MVYYYIYFNRIELDRRLRRAEHISPVRFSKPIGNIAKSEFGKIQVTCASSNASRPVYLVRRSRGFESRDEATASLVFLREFGVVWHVDDPQLCHMVFLSPVWLFRWLLRLLIQMIRQRPVSTAFVRCGSSATRTQSRLPRRHLMNSGNC